MDLKDIESYYYDCFYEWMDRLVFASTSDEHIRNKKIDLDRAKECLNNGNFNKFGLYMFGVGYLPRYIGKAEDQTLEQRLNSRYIPKKRENTKKQCDLYKKLLNCDKSKLIEIYDIFVETSDKRLILDELDGRPFEKNELLKRLGMNESNFKNYPERIAGAIDFAYHSTNLNEDLWLAVLPIDKDEINDLHTLERTLISGADMYIKKNFVSDKYKDLLNEKIK